MSLLFALSEVAGFGFKNDISVPLTYEQGMSIPSQMVYRKNLGTVEFMLAATKTQTDACILWPFSINHGGYARIRIDGIEYRVHRRICEIVHGQCPADLRDAAHRCGVRKCINPRHLYWASRSINSMDKIEHGTDNRGEKHKKAVLTEERVHFLRRAYGANENISEIARKWGVNIHTAINAARGRTWKWLPNHAV